MSVPYSMTDTSISAVINYSPKVIPSTHPNFAAIKKLLQRKGGATEKELLPLLDIPKAIENFTDGDVVVQSGKLFYKGFEVKTSLARFILKLVSAGQEAGSAPFKAFLANAHENPDRRASDDLYDWVVASGLPITSDGYILAWKAVSADYQSIHSGRRGRLSHKIGETVSEPRIECDANPDRTCSTGLHFCSAEYLKHYASGGNRVVAVKINPRDVVAFPKDYENQKGRCCEYTVVGEVSFEDVKTFYPQGKPIYKGFDPKPVPKPETAPRKTTKPKTPKTLTPDSFRVGQIWEQRNGVRTKIIGLDKGYVEVDVDTNGRFFNGRELMARPGPGDLVKLIKDASAKAPKVPNGKPTSFLAGQRWERRDGTRVTLKTTSAAQPYPLRDTNGERYAANGRGTNKKVGPRDLVRLVRK